MDTDEPKRKEIYTYTAPWITYSMAWNRSGLPSDKFKLAVGSYKEEYSNEIKIIQLDMSNTDDGTGKM